jgi:hypothetical protein
MPPESEPLEYFFDASNLTGLIRSGLTMLKAQKVQPRTEHLDSRKFDANQLANQAAYIGLIAAPAVILEAYQRVRSTLTGQRMGYPEGSWQFYLHFGLREDLAHHTNETIGYYQSRPTNAADLDDLTAWVMTVMQFLWGYNDLMGVIWDEWTTLRLVSDVAEEADLTNSPPFKNLLRQWEISRPYSAPLNGTYADVRHGSFDEFLSQRLEALPPNLRDTVSSRFRALASSQRENYQIQMSLLSRLMPGRFHDTKEPIPLWSARIGLVLGGRYYLLSVVDTDDQGAPVVYGPGGKRWLLTFRNGKPLDPSGAVLILRGIQLFRESDNEWVGYLDMSAASRIKGQLKQILEHAESEGLGDEHRVDILLAETPRKHQKRLRGLLPPETQNLLNDLAQAPIIINWDRRPRDTSLAELRRAHRGIGDHALTIMRTESSIIFDQSHVFFDGAWSMAMAEVLTSAAVQWCNRCITIAPSDSAPLKPLTFKPSSAFIQQAKPRQQVPEVSAETTIYDISLIFQLREMLIKTGTRLTINDLLVITRIFHASHYKPSPEVQKEIDEFEANASTPKERHAVSALERSLQRGRLTNPALLIPVDASLLDPQERIFPITFRNLADNLVWIWDDTWEAYQAYRRIEPPDTPEGIDALRKFTLKRTFLVGNLRAFSYILSANKSVAARGESLNIAVLKRISHLPIAVQRLLNTIPEMLPFLNEVIKGDEVYSNVGRVAKGSSITRFMSAKDDGNTKALVWGVMTDDTNRLIVTMRDFRPHVKPLVLANRIDLAHDMAQDYVSTYTSDLIGLVARLSAMLQTESPPT